MNRPIVFRSTTNIMGIDLYVVDKRCQISRDIGNICKNNKQHFYPNVTTLRSGLCCRNSVCLSVVCRLSVCLSVCNVGAPYSGG